MELSPTSILSSRTLLKNKKIFEYGGGFIQDRSIYEDTGIFAKMHFEKGTMSKVDYETYTSLFDAMVMTPYFPHPDLLIYLEGSFEDIVDRIQERGRPMEQQTPLDYWKGCTPDTKTGLITLRLALFFV